MLSKDVLLFKLDGRVVARGKSLPRFRMFCFSEATLLCNVQFVYFTHPHPPCLISSDDCVVDGEDAAANSFGAYDAQLGETLQTTVEF